MAEIKITMTKTLTAGYKVKAAEINKFLVGIPEEADIMVVAHSDDQRDAATRGRPLWATKFTAVWEVDQR